MDRYRTSITRFWALIVLLLVLGPWVQRLSAALLSDDPHRLDLFLSMADWRHYSLWAIVFVSAIASFFNHKFLWGIAGAIIGGQALHVAIALQWNGDLFSESSVQATLFRTGVLAVTLALIYWNRSGGQPAYLKGHSYV